MYHFVVYYMYLLSGKRWFWTKMKVFWNGLALTRGKSKGWLWQNNTEL